MRHPFLIGLFLVLISGMILWGLLVHDYQMMVFNCVSLAVWLVAFFLYRKNRKP